MDEDVIKDHYQELSQKYTGLNLKQEKGNYFVEGLLSFSAGNGDNYIEDDFEISIVIPDNYPETPPHVIETKGRIPSDFHTHSSGNTLCLATSFETKRKFFRHKNLIGFVETLLVPYFYAYSFYEKKGEMPFGELSHGAKGIYEYYQDLFGVDDANKLFLFFKILVDKSYKGHHPCPCGSGKILRKCHGSILREIIEVHGYDPFMYDYHLMVTHLLKDKEFRFSRKAMPKYILKKGKNKKNIKKR